MTFKYQEFIDRLIAEGCIMPKLYNPNGMKAYRFVFANNNAPNHKPILIQRPSRILPDNEKTSGYALSCFDDRQKARLRYSLRSVNHSKGRIRLLAIHFVAVC